jgi:UDPglucose 6-dehydrogenase
LREVSAPEDTRHPERNLIGIPKDDPAHKEKALQVLSVLPQAPYSAVMRSVETELVKYIGNNFLMTKVVFMNLMYDLVTKFGGDWQKVSEAVSHDTRIGTSHMQPVHFSGRGAGGHCFPKDFEALLQVYREIMNDEKGTKVLESIRDKNVELLIRSKKDLDLLEGIYGKDKITE